MDERLKQRLVGAAVLVLLAVIFVPMVLDRPSDREVRIEHAPLPPGPDNDFSSRIVPLTEPKTPLLQAAPRSRVAPPIDPPKPVEPMEPERTVAAAATMPAVKEKPVPPAEPAAEPGSVARSSKVAQAPAAWAIQLGSFSSAENAVALREKLTKLGYVAFIETAQVEGKEITRVFVGPELAKDRAGELVKKLQAETKLKGMVVQYPES